MIKVLQVFNKLNQGGIEHVVINLMKNMDSSKVEFHFAMMSGEKGSLDDLVLRMGGHIHYFSSGKKNLSNINKNLRNIIETYGPFRVVHSHVYFFSGYILYVASKMGVPIKIAHAHDVYKGEKENLPRKAYEFYMRKLINKYATYKFGVSKPSVDHVFGTYGTSNTFIVKNGIDLNKYIINYKTREKYRSKLHVQKGETLLCNIGRFEDQKDHAYLIEVFSYILKNDPNYKLVLIGNGSLKHRIKEKARNLAIDNKIIFLENRNDINDLLMASDMFVMPSKYEGLPLSLIEAQASGITCIISDNITSEVKISPNVFSLSKDSYSHWGDFIMKHSKDWRLDNIKRLDDAGYNEQKIAKFVEEKYLSTPLKS